MDGLRLDCTAAHEVCVKDYTLCKKIQFGIMGYQIGADSLYNASQNIIIEYMGRLWLSADQGCSQAEIIRSFIFL